MDVALTNDQKEPTQDAEVILVQGISGGVGTTNFAITLAYELSQESTATKDKVCILDLDIQNGNVATYLALPARKTIFESIHNGTTVSHESIAPYMISAAPSLSIISAPDHIAPTNILRWTDIEEIIRKLSKKFDYLVLDLPNNYQDWWEYLAENCDHILIVTQRDIRCINNLKKLLSEAGSNSPVSRKMTLVHNRRANFWQISERELERVMWKNTGISSIKILPQAHRELRLSNDIGKPLAATFPKSPYRLAVQKIANKLKQNRNIIA